MPCPGVLPSTQSLCREALRTRYAAMPIRLRTRGSSSTLLEPHPVDELGELIVGQVPAGRSAQYAADDPVISSSSPLIAGSAKTCTALRLLGVPERGVVGLVITGDGGKLTGKLPVLIHPFEKIGRCLVRGDVGEGVLGFPKEDVDVAFTRRSEGRPSTEGADISFGRDDVRGLASQSRPVSDA